MSKPFLSGFGLLLLLLATATAPSGVAAQGLAPAAPAAASATPAAAATASTPCASGENLLHPAKLDTRGVVGSVARTTDGLLAEEGTFWSAPDAVTLPVGSKFEFDMGAVHDLKAFVLQGDNNDDYVVEGSLDGVGYKTLWVAPPMMIGFGLRTRFAKLDKPVQARFVRVIGRGGDNFYSLSEIQAFCKVPAVWPPRVRMPPKKYGWDAIDNDIMVNVKGTAAVIAALLMIAAYFRRFYEARIARRWLAVIVTVMGSGTLFLAWLGRRVATATGPADLLKWGQVHASAPGLYYSAAMLFLMTLAAAALGFRKERLRLFDLGLAMVGLFSFFAWWNLGHYHFDHYIHIWEHYHYIVGAKYGPELRYGRLYQCTAVADIQDGLSTRVKARKMRRIESDNELGTSAEIMAHPEICTAAFKDPKRWDQFRSDIRFFRGRFSTERWDESQNDHGYNATPVWAIVARTIVDRVELTWDNIVKLGIIDSVFLVMMWLVVLWAFGWRAAAVAAVYWGTNFPARFYWNGGSFLRYDWLLWMTVGICFLRKRKHFWGGAALTYGALLRVFPGFVIVALILKALHAMVRERRVFLTPEHVRFAAGCIAALMLLIPLSSWAMNGLDAWPEFARNSEKHLKTALTNNMGLKTVMGYDFQTRAIQMRNDKLEDPFREWKDAKHRLYDKREPVLWALIILFCVMLARAGDREGDDWAAACLGTGLIVISAELTCYYYGFLMTYGLLWERRKLPGILAAVLGAFTCFIYDFFSWNDDHFAAMSLASVVVVVAVTAQSAFGKRANADATEPGTAPRPSRTKSTHPNSLPPIIAEPR